MRRSTFLLLTIFLSGCDETPVRGDAKPGGAEGPPREISVPVDLPGPGSEPVRADGPSSREAGGAAADCKNPRPAWLFCEDFEGMSAGFSAWRASWGWTDHIGADNPGRMTSSSEAHGGKFAVHYPAAASGSYKGADLIWRPCVGTNKPGCTLKGYPQLYLRAWVRFAADHKKVHHFLSVGGGPLTDYWAPFGNAGCRPNGKRGMGTTVDFTAGTHESFFYTYHPEMKCDPGTTCDNYADPVKICADCAAKGMPCSNGLECCWGNHYKPTPPVPLPVGKWFCFEMMMRANEVGKKNGEMAYWVDGKLALQVSNMYWRDVSELQMNRASLQHYLETEDAAGHSNQVWFDDVVVSTEPVGCP